MAVDAQNNPFIRNLASSDKEIRDQALDSLRAFLSGRSEISEIDLLKLWKGLFYCLWMQDKPALQQRLSRDLASLVSTLKSGVVLPFLRAFWITIAREWSQIEALRLDKYLYLIRQYVNVSFQYLDRKKWKGELVEEYVTIMEETPFNTVDMKIPNGLRFHALDVWVDELEKVAGEKIEAIPLEKILEPVEKLAKDGKLKAQRVAAKECLEDERVRAWRGEEDKEMKDSGEEEEEEEWGGISD